ncbi:type II toxin-antitoxin system YafQ family toxin [Schaalia sp. lx-100]|uniref:type II toxin-antitoxin system YafQ family toxin n=1 Tax=Schaalia sp. lx-100 TaxID=2899081 RepID=UPI002F2B4D53
MKLYVATIPYLRDIEDRGRPEQKSIRGDSLPAWHRDHALKGDYVGFRECHIQPVQPDWLLIYTINEYELILVATRTGTHSDLFST